MLTTTWQAIQKSHKTILSAYSNNSGCYANGATFVPVLAESLTMLPDTDVIGLVGNQKFSRMRGSEKPTVHARSHVPLKQREGVEPEGK